MPIRIISMIELFKILLLKKKGTLADMQDFPYLFLILHRKGKAICRNPRFFALLMRAEQHERQRIIDHIIALPALVLHRKIFPISVLQIQKSALFIAACRICMNALCRSHKGKVSVNDKLTAPIVPAADFSAV